MPRAGFPLTQTKLIVITALFFAVFHNLGFLAKVAETYSGAENLWGILASLFVVNACVLAILSSVGGFHRLLKPVLIVLLLVSSVTAYFIDTYGVVINSDMITNMLETDAAEVGDLLNLRLAGYIVLIGLLPAYLVSKVALVREPAGKAIVKRAGLILACLAVAGTTIFVSGDFYASFVRTHKIVRYYTNPTTPIYSLVKFVRTRFKAKASGELQVVGADAATPASDDHKELVVLVVGETARSDHFSLNGYGRETNPLLSRENVVSFPNASSCATSTAASVPCMFGFLERREFDKERSAAVENVLDVLKRSGVVILWRDNNSSSKGVADRVEYQSFKSPKVNPVCDPECRDEGMLAGLDDWVDRHQGKDMLIVLHQMGSHGPAYYKRYPDRFERFKPTCKSNELDSCTTEGIVNAYDNTILYTDYFLSRVTDWLKTKSPRFETAMLYFSDHGESLGESGVYLHGMPYALAPEAQTRVPAILWSPVENDDIDLATVRSSRGEPISHDNLFHTLLGIFEIKTGAYEPDKDILQYLHVYH